MNHCLLPGHYCIQEKKSKIRSSQYLLPFDLLIYTSSPFHYELVTNILPPLDNDCFKSKEHNRWIFLKWLSQPHLEIKETINIVLEK